jgi:hypothetical protein
MISSRIKKEIKSLLRLRLLCGAGRSTDCDYRVPCIDGAELGVDGAAELGRCRRS